MQIYILEFNRDIVNSFFHIKKIEHVQEERIQAWQHSHMKYITVKLIETLMQASSMMSLVKSYSDHKVMNEA